MGTVHMEIIVGKIIDETGNRYGRLIVISYHDHTVKDCRARWKCVCDCGNECVVTGQQLRNGQTTSCGCYQKELVSARNKGHWTGSKNPKYKGRCLTRNGYVLVSDPSHPNANSTGRLGEHTKVMSKKLGRPLLPGETVHHKNGIRDDNREENLELWDKSQPSGQRVEDKIRFYISYLEDHGYKIIKSGR